MRIINIFLLFTLSTLIGCSDYKLSDIGNNSAATDEIGIDTSSPEIDTGSPELIEEDDPKIDEPVIEEDTGTAITYPDIEVSRISIDFGRLNATGESDTQKIIVKNTGTADLNISDISLSLSAVYFITPILDNILSPGESSEFSITYDPITYETNTDIVIITSNDPDESTVAVNITGDGSAPIVNINPEHYDFGTTLVGCDEETNIEISNIGNIDLIVSDVTFFVTFPAEMILNLNEDANGPLPWTISPAGFKNILVGHEPFDVVDDAGFIEVTSNDPINSLATADQVAIGEFYDTIEDEFEQSDISSADILFVIDNSGSMGIWQTVLADNFTSFIDVFAVTGVDYQIAVITTDDSTFQGPILDSSTADIEIEFTDQVVAGTGGSSMEKGLQYAEAATQPGGDAGVGSDFLRDDAKLIIIFVSDEKDWSPKSDVEYATHFRSLKSSDGLIATHAVVGDSPSGCSSSLYAYANADYGEGYIEVSADLGGEFVSICSADWGVDLEALAHASILDRTFNLSSVPLEETIVVEVDGTEVHDWEYNYEDNTVDFLGSYVPDTGAAISINYAVLSECE